MIKKSANYPCSYGGEDNKIEKDYEILEIQYKYGSISSYMEELDSDLRDKTIFKIKRLSDGEIFKIGDLIEKKVVIGKFKIGFDNKVWVETEPNYYDSIQLNLLLNLKK
ncbi:MAG: hypothetical protein ACYC6J_09460 [Coriobacteriia bacterium]